MSRLDALRQRYSQLAEPQRSERRIELVLLVLAGLLLVQLLWLGAAALRDLRVTSVVPSADSLRVVAIQAVPAIRADESLALKARPLFWPSRRPAAADESLDAIAAAAAAAAAGDERPAPGLKALTISGIYGGGSQGGAIVQYSGQRLRVAIGEELDGWQLESVTPDEAVFVSAGVRDTHRLVVRPIAAKGEALPLSARSQSPSSGAVARRDSSVIAGQQSTKKIEASLTSGG